MNKSFTLLIFLFLCWNCSGECKENKDCDDGLFCNGSEYCLSSRCIRGADNICDDHKVCTRDHCDEALDLCTNTDFDPDNDGHFHSDCGGGDCDDYNPAVFPGAEEICDGVDNNCDSIVDEDIDGDGYMSILFCTDGTDCDDLNPRVHPGATEICDAIDNNCVDGINDEADTDGDLSIDITCGGDDCNDEDPLISPLSPEICNSKDDDCDGNRDEDFDCIRDVEYGCETTCGSRGVILCNANCTLSNDPKDCIMPDELCNGLDDDCDGIIDNNLPCASGNVASCTTTCGSEGSGICTSECLPALPEHCNPPYETCNGLDDDCDGDRDESFPCIMGEITYCEVYPTCIGLGTCTDTCDVALPPDCQPQDEESLCSDSLDNDCDGLIDCLDPGCFFETPCKP